MRHSTDIPWGLIIAAAMVIGAVIVLGEPTSMHRLPPPERLISGMGRLDDPLASAWALAPGQSTELEIKDVPYLVTRTSADRMDVVQVRGGQPIGPPMVLTPAGDLRAVSSFTLSTSPSEPAP